MCNKEAVRLICLEEMNSQLEQENHALREDYKELWMEYDDIRNHRVPATDLMVAINDHLRDSNMVMAKQLRDMMVRLSVFERAGSDSSEGGT